MTSSCSKCSQHDLDSKILSCGHYLCRRCLPINSFSEQIIIVCSACSIMSLIHINQMPTDTNSHNYVVCIDCKSQVMSIRAFLQSPHRAHNVVSVDKVVNDVHKKMKKYELSFDLENKALYNQVQSLIKQKRMITEQYSKNCLEIGKFYELLRNKINESELQANSAYEKIILDIVGDVDNKIRQVKFKILKCESYIQCLNYSMMKESPSKSLFVSQCYFKNYSFMDVLISQLIQTRKQTFNKNLGSFKIIQPNLNPLKSLITKIEGMNNLIWIKQERNQFKVSVNPQNEFERYFQQKRKQIFNNQTKKVQNNNINDKKITNQNHNDGEQFRKIDGNSLSNSSYKQSFSYNIEARIENLRKTLQLNENNKNHKSNFTKTRKND